MSFGETLIFSINGKIYSSFIKRYISRGIVQLHDTKLIPKMKYPNLNNEEDFEDTDEH